MPTPDYSLPAWLIPKGFDAQLERMASLKAMELGAQEQQQKREFALRTDQFRLQQQKANLDMAGQVMSNQMMSDEMEDQHAIQSVLPQWQQGNFDVDPQGLKTLKGMQGAERLKTNIMSQNAIGQARLQADQDYASAVQFDWRNAARLSQFPKYSNEWANELGNIQEETRLEKEAAATRLKRATMIQPGELPIQTTSDGRKYIQNPKTGAPHFFTDVPEEVNAIPMHDPTTGEIMGFGYMNSRGGWTPFKQESNKALESSLIRAKGKLARAKAIDAKIGSKDAYGEVAGAQAEVDTLQQALGQKPSTTPTAPKVGDVIKGYKFLGGDPANPDSWQKQ